MNDNQNRQATVETIDKMLLRVAKIQTYANGKPLSNASGFFCLHYDFLYLITSRHVVINEVESHRPDCLHVSLHCDSADLAKRTDLFVPLYADGLPQWYQPRIAGADLAAVVINDPHTLSEHFMDTFSCDDILHMDTILPLGQDVLILGFPLGLQDPLNNLPIVRRATIASSFSHQFKGEPYFLTDARLHRGMSGSPVVVKEPYSAPVGRRKPRWRLLGIHSSALDVSDRDPNQDERLALNITWYASLLLEMLPMYSPHRPLWT